VAQPGGGGTPPPRNWVHKKIPGCAVELNTQNCAWFGSQIYLITAMSFREAMPPSNHQPGAPPLDPAGGPPFPRPPVPPPTRPPVPPPPNPGCATAVMRSREVWARSACDVSVLDAGLVQRQSQRLDKHRSEAWFPSPDAMRCSFLDNGLGDRAAILGVFKPVCLEYQTLRSLMLA